ncbi:MAG TPA: hypothetical protein VGB02_08185 [Pyrinomonadaceae bacterium]|jgi:hypothetical protein
MEFSSIDDFYSFVEVIRQKLNQEGLSNSAEQLSFILNDGVYTTSSEIFGEIKLILQKIIEEKSGEVSNELLENIKTVISTIDKAFRVANGL